MSFLRESARVAGLAIGLSGLCAALAAAPSVSVSTRYYTVSGTSPLAVYSAIRSQGPKVGGTDVFATTTPRFSSTARAVVSGGQCRVADFRLKIRFDLLLPRLPPQARLTPAEKRDWAAFAGHVRAHEMHHVALWTACAREAEAAVMRVRAADCGDTDRIAAVTYAAIRKSCDARHAAYDAAEGRQLPSYAFMRQVLASQPGDLSSPGGDDSQRAFSQPRRRSWFPFGQ